MLPWGGPARLARITSSRITRPGAWQRRPARSRCWVPSAGAKPPGAGGQTANYLEHALRRSEIGPLDRGSRLDPHRRGRGHAGQIPGDIVGVLGLDDHHDPLQRDQKRNALEGLAEQRGLAEERDDVGRSSFKNFRTSDRCRTSSPQARTIAHGDPPAERTGPAWSAANRVVPVASPTATHDLGDNRTAEGPRIPRLGHAHRTRTIRLRRRPSQLSTWG